MVGAISKNHMRKSAVLLNPAVQQLAEIMAFMNTPDAGYFDNTVTLDDGPHKFPGLEVYNTI